MKPAGPADWMVALLTMNSTMATKMTTMSNDPRTRVSITGAIFSDARDRSSPVVPAVPASTVTALTSLGDRWSPSRRTHF